VREIQTNNNRHLLMIFFLLSREEKKEASRRKFVAQISFIVLVVSRISLAVEDFLQGVETFKKIHFFT
jgi:hypothetical protein